MLKNINLELGKLYVRILNFYFLLILCLLPVVIKAQGSAPTNRTTGSPAGSYQLSGFDTVSLFGGNLNFNLPLLNVSGRGEVSQGLSLNLQTQWGSTRTDDVNGNISYVIQPTTDDRLALVGRLTTEGDNASLDYQSPCNSGDGTIYYPVHHQFHFTYVEADGTEHKLVDRISRGRPWVRCGELNASYGRIFESVGGEFMSFIADADVFTQSFALNGYLYFKNGVQSRVEGGKILWSLDRNGNKIEYTYHPNYNFPFYIPRPTKIKDSIGREVNIEYDVNDSAPYGLCHRIIYKGTGGQERIIRISKDWLHNNLRTTQTSDSNTVKTIGELFPVPSGGNVTVGNASDTFDHTEFINAVWLPDGRSYKFKYSVYGRLARVELPTGGATEYDFELSADSIGNYDGVLNRVKEKRVYKESNILETKTTFAKSIPLPSDQITGGTVVTVENFDANDHRLSKNRHLFYGGPSGEHSYNLRWTDGKEFRTETYDSDGTTLLRRLDMNWKQRTPSWCYNYPYGGQPCWGDPPNTAPISNPFILETKETLADGNLVKLTSSINPTTGEWAVDSFNNITDVWEYDYGDGQPGQFLRRTHTDYITGTNYTYYGSSYLPSLPTQIWVSPNSNGSTKASLTVIEYDNYSGGNNALLTPRANVVGHDSSYDSNHTSRGNVTKITKYGNAQNQTEAISVYTNYDVLGNVIKTYDAKGNSTIFNYNDNFGSANEEARINTTLAQLNGQSTFAFPTNAINWLEWTTYAQFDYFTGQIVNTEDTNGVVSKTIYNDLLDRPTKKVTAVGTTLEMQTSINYVDNERRIEFKSDLNSPNDNLIKSEAIYDGLGRMIETRRYETDVNYTVTKSIPFAVIQDPETSTWRFATKVSNPYRPNAGESPIWTTTLADSLGRSIKTITSDNAIFKNIYSGDTVTTIDQAEKRRRIKINALQQLIRIDEPNDIGQLDLNGSPVQSTNYSYDALGNLTQVQQIGTTGQQCNGLISNCVQTRTFIFDSLSRLKQAINPESGTDSYHYDNNSNLTQIIDGRGVQVNYIYDGLNRVTERSYANEPVEQALTPTVSYTYDNIANAKGRLTKISSSASETRYTNFDELGRYLSSEQLTTDAQRNGTEPAYSMSYKYNLAGALIEQTYPSTRVVKTILDNEGDLSMVQSKKNDNYGFWNYARNFTYTAAGMVSSMQLGNFTWESMQFNSRLQPTQIGLGSTRSATNILKIDYSYGDIQTNGTVDETKNNGNITKQAITVPSVGNNPGFTAVQTYNYDSLNRIKDATETISGDQNWKQTFKYDRFGNRSFDEDNTNGNYLTTTLIRGCTTSVYNPNGICDKKKFNPNISSLDNRVIQDQDGDNQNDYLFDFAGNTKKDASGNVYFYNGESKLIEVRTSSNQTVGQYWYDGSGNRIKKKTFINGQWDETIFVYDALGRLVAEYSNNPSQTQKVNYLTADHLSSTRIITDQNGKVLARQDFKPFGEDIATSQRIDDLGYSYSQIRQKFTGYERDSETELDFAKARMYSAGLGRFNTADPGNTQAFLNFDNPQSWNAYTYVNNNPLNDVDRTGKSCDWCQKLKNLVGGYGYITNAERDTEMARRRQVVDTFLKDDGNSLIGSSGDRIVDDVSQLTDKEIWKAAARIENGETKRTVDELPPDIREKFENPELIDPPSWGGSKAGGGPSGQDPARLQENLKRIFQRFKVSSGRCEAAAKKVLGAFQREGKTGKIIEIRDKYKAAFWKDATGKEVTRRGFHQVVEVEGRYYDALTGPNGATREEYIKLFEKGLELVFNPLN